MHSDSVTLSKLADEYWQAYLGFNPVMATMLGVDGYDDRMADPSREGSQRQVQSFTALRDRLAGIDATNLDGVEQVTLAMLAQRLDDERDAAAAGLQEVAISANVAGELSGILATVPQARLTTAERAQAYLGRLAAIGAYFDQLTRRYCQAKADGRYPTALGVRQAIEQIDGYLVTEPARDPLLRPSPPDPDWTVKAEALVKDTVRPALARMRDCLANEILPVGRDDERVGVCHIPGGLSGYSSNVALHTTTTMTAEEIHRAGEELVAQLSDEIDEVGAAAFGTTGAADVLQRVQRECFGSAEEIMRCVLAAYHRAEQALPGWFRDYRLPPCGLEEMNELQARGGIAAYYMWPAVDGSRLGTMWINTDRPQERSAASYEVLAFHEGVPGHHLQAVVSGGAELPAFRQHRRISAHSEGWGLYVEHLADEMGLYSSPVFRLGMLSSAAWRAARLVIDTGLHHFGWSRSRAVQYLRGCTSLSRGEIDNEIDRYIAAPGQALSYFIGRVRLDALRAKAQGALGSRFEIAEFHHRVLAGGSVPLDVLDKFIDRWIDETLAV